MTRTWPQILALTIIACTPVLIYFAVRANSNNDGDSAKSELGALSAASQKLAYSARFRGTAEGITAPEDALVIHQVPGTGFRIEFDSPIGEEDDESLEDILKSGDILILSSREEVGSASCRTERGSCRSIDGLEILVLASFMQTFVYPGEGIYKQPHTVETLDSTGTFGEEARCFVVREKDPEAIKTQPAGFGFVIGEGLPATLCFALDGLPLFYAQEGDSLSSPGIRAAEVERGVADDALDLPLPFVQSIYDRED